MNKVLGALLVIAALPILAGEAVDDSTFPNGRSTASLRCMTASHAG